MAAYEGDKIKLAPVAATYDVEIERTIQEGVVGEWYIFFSLESEFVEGSIINIEDFLFKCDDTEWNPAGGISIVLGTMDEYYSYYDDNYICKSMYLFEFQPETATIHVVGLNENVNHLAVGSIPVNYPAEFEYTVEQEVEPQQPIVEKIISPNTFVDKYGKLHIGKDLQAGDIIRIKSTSTYINPSGETETMKDTQSVVVI